MKKTLRVILSITWALTLIGCSNSTENVSTHPDTSLNQQTLEKKSYNKDEAIATFRENKDFNDYEISDYVLVNDANIPMLKAVISFKDKKEDNSCNLAFVYGDTSNEVCFAVNEVEGVKTYEIADNSRLIYVGNGIVTTSIRKIDTNEVVDYNITFSYEESTSTTNFKVVAEKPTK